MNFKPDGELSQLDRIRDLAIHVGAIALNGTVSDDGDQEPIAPTAEIGEA